MNGFLDGKRNAGLIYNFEIFIFKYKTNIVQ